MLMIQHKKRNIDRSCHNSLLQFQKPSVTECQNRENYHIAKLKYSNDGVITMKTLKSLTVVLLKLYYFSQFFIQ